MSAPAQPGRGGRWGALAGAAALVTALTLASRVVGFGRWFAQNAWVGPNEVGAAYSTANTVPNVLFEVAAGGALAGAVIPLLAAPIAARLRGDVDRTASALLGWAMVVLIPAAALTWWCADLVMAGLLSGAATPAQLALATDLLRIFAPQIPLYGVGVVLSGVLQSHRRFGWPAAAPLVSSLVVMASYLAFDRVAGPAVAPEDLPGAAVAWLGWGTTAGVVAMTLPLLVPVHRAGVRLRPTLRFPDGVGRRAAGLAASGMGTLVAQQVSVVVAVTLANRYGSPGLGTVNVHQYSQAMVLLPYAVLAVPLATVMFPRLASWASRSDLDRLARGTASSTRVIVAVSCVGIAALLAAAPAVEIVFEVYARSGSVDGMAQAVTAGAGAVLGLALTFHLTRVLYALEKARAAVLASSLGWASVAAVSFVAVALLGAGRSSAGTVQGLGLGSSLGTLIGGLALVLVVRAVLGSTAVQGLRRTAGVAVLAAAVGGGVGRWVVTAALSGQEPSAPVALAGGLAGAILAAGIVAALVVAFDRDIVVQVSQGVRSQGRTGGGEP